MTKSRLKLLIGKGIYRSLVFSQARLTSAREARTSGKHNISYYELGNPNNETIILVHGFGDSKEAYLMTAKQLFKDYHILIPDLPGFGDNPHKQDHLYNLEYIAESVLELVHEKNISQFHLLGNSLGGATSMEIALKNSGLIKSLILIDTAGFFQDGVHSVFHDFIAGNNIFQVKSEDEYRQLLERVFVKPPYIPAPLFSFFSKHCVDHHDWYGKMVRDLTGNITTLEDQSRIEELSFNHKASAIEAPTLLIWGDQDSLFPLELGKLANSIIPNSQLEILSGSGHAPQYENFKGYIKAVKSFLDGLE